MQMEKEGGGNFQGIWMPANIMQMNDLTMLDKVILSYLHSMSKTCNEIYTSNRKLADYIGVNYVNVSRAIKRLSEKGFIETHIPYNGGKRFITVSEKLRVITVEPLAKCKGTISETLTPHYQKAKGTISETLTDNKEYNKEDNKPYSKDYLFEQFWNDYDKKVNRIKCQQKFDKLTKAEKQKIKSSLPAYIRSTPDKQFRKNPLTYLNNKAWDDEIAIRSGSNPKTRYEPHSHYEPQTFE